MKITKKTFYLLRLRHCQHVERPSLRAGLDQPQRLAGDLQLRRHGHLDASRGHDRTGARRHHFLRHGKHHAYKLAQRIDYGFRNNINDDVGIRFTLSHQLRLAVGDCNRLAVVISVGVGVGVGC